MVILKLQGKLLQCFKNIDVRNLSKPSMNYFNGAYLFEKEMHIVDRHI